MWFQNQVGISGALKEKKSVNLGIQYTGTFFKIPLRKYKHFHILTRDQE